MTEIDMVQIETIADLLGVEVEALLAVIDVESPAGPFLASGRPVILFEAHVFHRETGGRFDASHPHLSQPTWAQGKRFYKGGEAEWGRLNEAADLDAEAAFKSASWGMFQIMGFNHEACGFASVDLFVSAMKTVRGQVKAFWGFIRHHGLQRYLRDHDWASFAKAYNGPGYKTHGYDKRIAEAYETLKGAAGPEPGTLAHKKQRADAAYDAIKGAADQRRE